MQIFHEKIPFLFVVDSAFLDIEPKHKDTVLTQKSYANTSVSLTIQPSDKIQLTLSTNTSAEIPFSLTIEPNTKYKMIS